MLLGADRAHGFARTSLGLGTLSAYSPGSKGSVAVVLVSLHVSDLVLNFVRSARLAKGRLDGRHLFVRRERLVFDDFSDSFQVVHGLAKILFVFDG
jgi:hypothetical protein